MHTAIVVRDLEEAIAFYKEIGFTSGGERRGRYEVYCQFFRRQGQHMHVDRIDKKRLPN